MSLSGERGRSKTVELPVVGDPSIWQAFVGSFDAPNDLFPVPIGVDNEGFIYTADYENGQGTAPADIFRFSPDGATFTTVNDPGLYGPFGGAISGVVLGGDPPVLYGYPVIAEDADGDTLSFSLITAPSGMSIEPDSGLISWPITSQATGSHSVEVRVSDGAGGVDAQSFDLLIQG